MSVHRKKKAEITVYKRPVRPGLPFRPTTSMW
jgi:hypothetical protein